MTTHNTHHEDSDVDTSVVEYSPAPEATVDPTLSQTAQTQKDGQETGSNSVEPVSPATFTQEEPQEVPAAAEGAADVAPEDSKSEESLAPSLSEEQSKQENVAEPTSETHEQEAVSSEVTPPVVAAEEVQQPVEEKQPEESKEQETRETPAGVSEVQAEVPAAVVEESKADEPVVPEQRQESDVVITHAEVAPLVDAKAEDVRPFTDFIEEFRQAEAARKQAKINEAQVEQFGILTTNKVESEHASSAIAGQQKEDAAVADTEQIAETVSPVESNEADEQSGSKSEQREPEETETAENEVKVEEATPEVVRPAVTERAVSPLLRPASRLRIPRHSMRHQREEPVIAELPVPAIKAEESEVAPVAESSEAAAVEAPAKPARRYRFDRPASKVVTPLGAPSASKRSEAIRATAAQQLAAEMRSEAAQPTTENAVNPTTSSKAAEPAAIEPAAAEAPVAENVSVPVVQAAPAANESGRRRHGHKEQHIAPAAAAPSPTPAAEVAAVNPEIAAKVEEAAPEDLPPLEYAELQKASSRRRRRHRSSASTNVAAAVQASVPAVSGPAGAGSTTVTPKIPGVLGTPNVAGITGMPAIPSMPAIPAIPAIPGVSRVSAINNSSPVTPDLAEQNGSNGAGNYTIVSGYTVSQMNQGNDLVGPFMGPEPSPARGSVFTRDGRNTRAEVQVQRTNSPSYPTRGSESGLSAASMTQFANIVSQAIQTQTDRMVTELRRNNQAPTNVSVSLPPFPSTERVGVFVDVANLLYSARTLRMAVDFGKLLDFLRGNRRLVRAHAYCPTSPQVTEEQMFLQAVKGLGYRITTKNYKTFSSGAKKADLDLDLCMDVVRLVDGGAVDCIVLVSGDSDFMPMLDYCSDHGVRVEVAAFDEAMSATLRQSCDLFVNLSMLEEIRA